jgi:hypothetical protein
MQEEPNNESPSLDELEHLENAEPQKTLSRRKRGVAPVVGMPCESGYKHVGDDCVTANIEFE